MEHFQSIPYIMVKWLEFWHKPTALPSSYGSNFKCFYKGRISKRRARVFHVQKDASRPNELKSRMFRLKIQTSPCSTRSEGCLFISPPLTYCVNRQWGGQIICALGQKCCDKIVKYCKVYICVKKDSWQLFSVCDRGWNARRPQITSRLNTEPAK